MPQTDMGARLKAQRIARGMTQQQVADLVGVSYQQIQKYEKGDNYGADRLQVVATALDVSPLYFFASDDELKGEAQTLATSAPGVRRLVCAYNKIKSARLKAHMLALLEEIALLEENVKLAELESFRPVSARRSTAAVKSKTAQAQTLSADCLQRLPRCPVL